jgi:DNA-directed RNA polymerase subunit omega
VAGSIVAAPDRTQELLHGAGPRHDDEPPVERLLDRVDSKFSLVTLAARRARNINSYFNQLGEGLGHMVPPQVSSVARKPLSIAFEEIAADKIVWTEPAVESADGSVDESDGGG